MSEKEYQELAQQLRCPSGDRGSLVSESMFTSNQNMIYKTIDRLDLNPGDKVVELGFGNGRHIPYLLQKKGDLHYTGIEISELMLEKAKETNSAAVTQGFVEFLKIEAENPLPFPDNSYHHFLSVNTIYFWSDLAKQLYDIHRILKPNGHILLSFIEKKFAKDFPFTQFYFNFHSTDLIIRLLRNIGFFNIEKWEYIEKTISKDQQKVVRPFTILKAYK